MKWKEVLWCVVKWSGAIYREVYEKEGEGGEEKRKDKRK